jgi:acetyltransferase-like isoleucine patch superfamily enzyme
MKSFLRKAIHGLLGNLFRRLDLLTILTNIDNNKKVEFIHQHIKFIGVNVRFNGKISIDHPVFLHIGNNVHVNDNTSIAASGGVIIGDNTHISRNVVIYSHNHNYHGTVLPYDNTHIYKSVIIGQNVWIGTNVCITPGVTIGEGAIIGMGTVVSKDVPPYAIVGNPQTTILKYRNIEHYNKLKNTLSFGGINGNPIPKEEISAFKKSGNNGENMFFIVSTGRAGSMSIAKILNQHNKILCLHEPNAQLIRLSTEYAYSKITKEQVRTQIEATYSKNGFFPHNVIYGESDQKLSNLISIIAEVLPKAKFIWLIRKPAGFIYSGVNRGWYNSVKEVSDIELLKQWIEYRIEGNNLIENPVEQWDIMTAIEKNAWYWSYWNTLILEQLHNISKNRWIKVRLEELNEKITDIAMFLGVDNSEVKIVKTNTGDYKNIKSLDKVELDIAIERFCVNQKLLYHDNH